MCIRDSNITANGRTVQDQETALSTLPNVKVKQVHVREGESVKAGDPLFTLDTDDLNAQILSLNQEIEKMKLQAQAAASNSQLDQENKENSIARAREDYNTAKEKTDKLIPVSYTHLMLMELAGERTSKRPRTVCSMLS